MKPTFRYGKGLAVGLTGLALTAVCMGSPAQGLDDPEYYVISHGRDIAVVSSTDGDVEALVAGCGYDAGDYIVDVDDAGDYTAVTLLDAMDVSVTCDGATFTARTTGGTVEQLLEELDLELSPDDVISHDTDTAVYDGLSVRVYRVTYAEEYTDETVAHGTKYTDDDSLAKGTEKTVTEGSDGVKRVYYSVKYVDGAEDSRERVREETVTEAVDTVISRGTKVETKKADTSKSNDTKNTNKNSGTTNKNNNTSNNTDKNTSKNTDSGEKNTSTHSVTVKDGTITTSSGETFTYSKVINMKATAYSYDAGSMTASGVPVQVGIVAAKPGTIPQGTRVYIVTEDGKYTYGPAIVGDTPGGDIIDLFYETEAECRQFGVRQANVYILS